MNIENPPLYQGQIWWADISAAVSDKSEQRRPVLVIQADALNRSRLHTVVCINLTTNWRLAQAPGHVLLSAADTHLPRAYVAQTPQIITLSKHHLIQYISTLPPWVMETVLDGVQTVLGRV